MISRYTIDDFRRSLRELNLPKDAVLLTSVSFFKLGALSGNFDKSTYFEVLCQALLEELGEAATLVINSFTSQVGRFGHPFIWESTETTTGSFNEWVLKRPGRYRSLHPLHSVAAIGPKAAEICENVGRMNYGIGTPFDRMAAMKNVYVLRIGIDPYFNAFAHYAEAVCGAPYFYVKYLDAKVIKNGQEIPGPWFAHVRYLHFPVDYNLQKLAEAVDRANLRREIQVGAGCISVLEAKPYIDLLFAHMIDDPFFLLGGIPEVPIGSIPRDGTSVNRDGISIDKSALA